MIKTLLFDYAGVITPTRDNYTFAQKYHKQFNMEPLELMHKTYLNWDKALVGEISDKQFWNDVGKELSIDPKEIKKMITETFTMEERLIDLIDRIRDQYTIAMVSNQVEDWLEKAIDDNNLRNRFHYFINSYHVGAKKPDPKIFLEALKQTKQQARRNNFCR
jgi:FMN phosphatase YigB (HAD superfamily)